MTDEAFLQAIRENPDDDMPRLIFADWLEDYTQPERAEFVRLQVALARLPEDHPARPALQTRERGLLLDHERDWTLGLRHLADSWQFRRGLVDEVLIDRRLTAEQLAELFRWPVVRRVVTRHGWRVFPGLVRCPEARVLEEVLFANTRLAERLFRDLVECPHFERLHTLEVSNCQIERRGLTWLVRSPLLGRLRSLVLSGNNLGSSAAELFRSPQVGNLRLLDLSGCRLNAETAVAIASAPLLRGLTTLRLGNNVLGDAGCATLLGCPHLAGLQDLNLDHTHAGEATWSALLQADFPCSLRRLSVHGARLWSSDLFHLLASGRLGSLEVLDLSGSSLLDDSELDPHPEPQASRPGNRPLALCLNDLWGEIGNSPAVLVRLFLTHAGLGRAQRLSLRQVADHPAVFHALLRSPHLGGLRCLDLVDCSELDGEMFAALLGSELMERLTALNLGACHLVDQHAIELAGHPNARHLTWLGLNSNSIGSRGARALAESPHLRNLRHLDLSGNRIDDDGALALARTPHLGSPVVLDLAENPIGREGTAALLRAAREQFERSVTIPHMGA